MLCDQFRQILLITHLSGRVVRIAKPDHTHVLRHCIECVQRCDLVPMHAAGIGILTKRRHQNGRVRSPKGLRYQINGFRSTIRHANRSGRQSVAVRQTGLQRIRFRFGISGYGRDAPAQMCTQSVEVHLIIYVGTEIAPYRVAVFIRIVSVSFNHCLSIFDR